MKIRIAFLCANGPTRSVMADAIARHLVRVSAGPRFEVEVLSASSQPDAPLDPRVRATLEAHRISAEGLHSQEISKLAGQSFDYVVAICDRGNETMPSLPGSDPLYWGYSDPAKENADRAPAAFKSLALGLLLRVRLLLEYHAHMIDTGVERPRSSAELNGRLIRFAISQTRGSVSRLLGTAGPEESKRPWRA
jgi:protein-tyrosine-phosphatase